MHEPITYTVGDATDVGEDRPVIVAHVCNDRGWWGRGFVLAVSARWPEAEAAYRAWHAGQVGQAEPFGLGAVQFVDVAPGVQVANMIAQRGVRGPGNPRPIRYDALGQCLATLGEHAARQGATVRMPRIGCGLAGGTWDRIQPLIARHLCAQGVPVVVVDPPAPLAAGRGR